MQRGSLEIGEPQKLFMMRGLPSRWPVKEFVPSQVQWIVFLTSPAASVWQVEQASVTSSAVVNGPLRTSNFE